jgi:hypothetical protein
VGGVIGGIAILILAALFFLVWRRRRDRSKPQHEEVSLLVGPPKTPHRERDIVPFTLASPRPRSPPPGLMSPQTPSTAKGYYGGDSQIMSPSHNPQNSISHYTDTLSSGSGVSSDAAALRREFEDLRREVHVIAANNGYDAPPSYA